MSPQLLSCVLRSLCLGSCSFPVLPQTVFHTAINAIFSKCNQNCVTSLLGTSQWVPWTATVKSELLPLWYSAFTDLYLNVQSHLWMMLPHTTQANNLFPPKQWAHSLCECHLLSSLPPGKSPPFPKVQLKYHLLYDVFLKFIFIFTFFLCEVFKFLKSQSRKIDRLLLPPSSYNAATHISVYTAASFWGSLRLDPTHCISLASSQGLNKKMGF